MYILKKNQTQIKVCSSTETSIWHCPRVLKTGKWKNHTVHEIFFKSSNINNEVTSSKEHSGQKNEKNSAINDSH